MIILYNGFLDRTAQVTKKILVQRLGCNSWQMWLNLMSYLSANNSVSPYLLKATISMVLSTAIPLAAIVFHFFLHASFRNFSSLGVVEASCFCLLALLEMDSTFSFFFCALVLFFIDFYFERIFELENDCLLAFF